MLLRFLVSLLVLVPSAYNLKGLDFGVFCNYLFGLFSQNLICMGYTREYESIRVMDVCCLWISILVSQMVFADCRLCQRVASWIQQ